MLSDEAAAERAAVVPYVGTWIEIYLCQNSDDEAGSRSLRGNVDRNIPRMSSHNHSIMSFPTWERG